MQCSAAGLTCLYGALPVAATLVSSEDWNQPAARWRGEHRKIKFSQAAAAARWCLQQKQV
jgi:hypothetical protein